MKTNLKIKSGKDRGFSLVEVTLAIGITAVALVSLLGMLPKGMATLQRATDEAVTGRIHQQIMGEIQLTPWESEGGGGSPLDRFDRQIRYYDDQGIQMTETDRQRNPQFHVYTARITLPRSVVKLPGEESVANIWSRLVIVDVTSSQDPRFLDNPATGFDSILSPRTVYNYRTIISKFGQQYGQ